MTAPTVAPPARRSGRTGSILRAVLVRSWLPVLMVAVWGFASLGRDTLYFPSLQTIVRTIRTELLGSAFTEHLLPSVGKVLVGFLVAAVLGIVIGVVIGLSPVLRAATEPVIQFLRSLPPPVLLPVGILVFGIGASMDVAIIVLGAIWPTLLNTIDGVRSLDSQLRDVGRSYRLTFWQKMVYPGEVLVESRDLKKAYGDHQILDGLDFEVRRGEFVCIVGPSGSGKTTLLRCVAGLLEPSAGKVVFEGERVSEPPAKLAVVFQDYSRRSCRG